MNQSTDSGRLRQEGQHTDKRKEAHYHLSNKLSRCRHGLVDNPNCCKHDNDDYDHCDEDRNKAHK